MLKKIKPEWSPQLSYLIGVIATDGNLSPDGRHITITSKDADFLLLIRARFNLTSNVGKKRSGLSQEKKYSVLQIGDVNFYRFLLSIGLTPKKSKTIGALNIPPDLFGHFFRGCIDGDGSITLSNHPETTKKQLRIRLCSASKKFVLWTQENLNQNLELGGGWIYSPKTQNLHTLSYGKADSVKILQYMYHGSGKLYLDRKFKIAKQFLGKHQIARVVKQKTR